MRVVLDTNVIISAFGTRGLCADLFAVCLDRHQLIISAAILDEVTEHLVKKFKLPESRTREIVSFLREHSETVIPVEVPADACRDQDDCVILGTAVGGSAEYLITGDRDLLDLGKFGDVSILSPREFYDLIK